MTLGRDVSLFNRFARLYELAMPATDPEPLERGIAFAEQPVKQIVEIGGGTGRVAREVDATVVDPARGMLQEARRYGVPSIQGDASRLPLRDASSNAVLIVDALHHFPDRKGALQEAARVLTRGGVLVVRDFDPTTRRGKGIVLAERVVGFGSQFWSAEDLAAEITGVGLDAKIVEYGFTYTVVGVKESGTEDNRQE